MALTLILLHWSLPFLILPPGTGAQPQRVTVQQPNVNFGKVRAGLVLEHTFTLRNNGDMPLRIKQVRLTPPLVPRSLPKQIPAGAHAEVRLTLDTKGLAGEYDGVVLVSFAAPDVADVELTVTGQVVLMLEAKPPVIVLTAQRGETAEKSIEIVNHDPEPVLIYPPADEPSRFTARLDAIEPGRRFRLTIVMAPNGPAGRSKETIVLKTSSPIIPELRIAAFVYLHERVYTFPDALELGVLRIEDVRRDPDLVKRAAQTLMVYRKGTTDFHAKFSTDIPHLVVDAKRGPLGDRYQLVVSLSPDTLNPGPIQGTIVIETNDPEFPRLTVPVVGRISERGVTEPPGR